MRDSFFYNKYKKENAYLKLVSLIQDEFQKADIAFVKKKIKNIRNSFRKEYKKQKIKIREGKTYKPKLW